MTDQTNEERARAVIASHLGVPAAETADNADLMADLGADALDIVEVQMKLEEEFGIEITDAEADGFETVQSVIALIIAKTGAAQPA